MANLGLYDILCWQEMELLSTILFLACNSKEYTAKYGKIKQWWARVYGGNSATSIDVQRLIIASIDALRLTG